MENEAAAPVVLPSLDVQAYDPWTDTIVIEGTRYSGALFRDGFGFGAAIGQVLRIDQLKNGVVTITRLREIKSTYRRSSDEEKKWKDTKPAYEDCD